MGRDNLQKLNCEHFREDILLADFTEKEDGKGGNGFVLSSYAHGHIESCASCKEFFGDVRNAARAVKMLHVTAPSDFMEVLHERIVWRTPRPFVLFPIFKPVAAAAVLLFAFLTVLSATRKEFKPENIASARIRFSSAFDILKSEAMQLDKAWQSAASSVTPAGTIVKAAPKIKRNNKNVRATNLAFSTKHKKALSGAKHQTPAAIRVDKPDMLHERMVQIQVKSDRPVDNVSIVFETEGGAFLEGENADGNVLTWLGAVSNNQPVALLIPVKAGGKKAVKIKTTVVTSDGEILYESVSFKGSKKSPAQIPSQDNNKSKDENVPGRFLVFIPSSSDAPKNLPSSGISVSVQTGSLALSDARVENVAYVPNPGGSLELVFADTKVSLTDAQVVPEKN